MIRRFVGVTSAVSVLAFAGLTAAPATASAQTVGACTVSGTASISPGLGAVPTAESVTFGGSIGCTGLVNGSAKVNQSGSFSGSLNCPLGGLITCVPFANISYTSTVVNCSAGILLQQGALVEVVCTSQPVQVAVVVFTPNGGPSTNVTSVSFNGVVAAAIA